MYMCAIRNEEDLIDRQHTIGWMILLKLRRSELGFSGHPLRFSSRIPFMHVMLSARTCARKKERHARAHWKGDRKECTRWFYASPSGPVIALFSLTATTWQQGID